MVCVSVKRTLHRRAAISDNLCMSPCSSDYIFNSLLNGVQTAECLAYSL